MLDKLILIILLTFVPVFELRWSIPIGIYSGTLPVPFIGAFQGFALPVWIVFLVAVSANILLGPMVYFFLDKLINVFLKVKWVGKCYNKLVVRTQKRSKNLVDKYGLIGIALFVAVPLPGSGSWTGALAAKLLNMGYKRFFIANAIGVTIAGAIVTAVSVGLFSFI